MSWTVERFRYQKIATSIEPAAVVVTKDSWLWTALYVLGLILTLGLLRLAFSRRRFLEDLAVTVGPWQGYWRGLRELRNELVAHESGHTTQTTWFGWLFFPIAWINRKLRSVLGLPGFAIAYFLLLPVGFAFGRFYLELDADRRAWRLGLKEGWMSTGEVLVNAGIRAELLSSRTYFYTWPKSWSAKAYEKMAREIIYEATR